MNKLVQFFEKSIKYVVLPIIITFVGYVIITQYFQPRWDINKARRVARITLIDALQNDPNIMVKRAAVVAVGNLQDQEAILILSKEYDRNKELAEKISFFIRNQTGITKRLSPSDLVRELSKCLNDLGLVRYDDEARMIKGFSTNIDTLRKIRYQLNQQLLTPNEQRLLDNMNIIEKIDFTIDVLQADLDRRLAGTDESLIGRMHLLGSRLDAFIGRKGMLEGMLTREVTDLLQDFSEQIDIAIGPETSKGMHPKEVELKKYIEIVSTLSAFTEEKGTLGLEAVVKERNVPRSVRIKAVETLGEMADADFLPLLIEKSKSDDPELRAVALISISKILAYEGKRKWIHHQWQY